MRRQAFVNQRRFLITSATAAVESRLLSKSSSWQRGLSDSVWRLRVRPDFQSNHERSQHRTYRTSPVDLAPMTTAASSSICFSSRIFNENVLVPRRNFSSLGESRDTELVHLPLESLAQRLLSYHTLQDALDDGYDRNLLLQHVSTVVYNITSPDDKGERRRRPIVLKGETSPRLENQLSRQLGTMLHTLVLPEHNMEIAIENVTDILQAVISTLRCFAQDAAHPSARANLDDAYMAQDLLYKIMSARLPDDSTLSPEKNFEGSMKGRLVFCLNHTLQIWAALAGGGVKNVKAQRIAVQNAESLLLQAGQQQLSQEESNDSSDGSTPSFREDSSLSSLTKVMPDVVGFNTVMTAWANCAKSSNEDNFGTHAAERAQALLYLLVELSGEPSSDKVLEPTSVSYDVVLKAWTESGDKDAFKHAMAVLYNMIDNYEHKGHVKAKPTPWTIANMFNILTKLKMPDIETQVQELEQIMTSLSIIPNTSLNNAMLTAHYRSRPHKAQDQYVICENMDRIVQDMEASVYAKPDRLSYQTVLQAWVDCGLRFHRESNYKRERESQGNIVNDCAKNAERHLQAAAQSVGIDIYMVHHVMAGFAVTNARLVESVFSTSFAPLSQSKDDVTTTTSIGNDNKSNVRATVESYRILLDAFDRASNPKQEWPAQKAQEYLDELTRDPTRPRPDTGCYNAVIRAWVATHSQNGAKRADAVLDELLSNYEKELQILLRRNPRFRLQARPNTTSFQSVISALCEHCHEENESLERVENLVELMESMERSKSTEPDDKIAKKMAKVRPNVITYNILLNMYAKQATDKNGLDDKAEQLINRMRSSGDNDIRPDRYSYSALMNAYGRSGAPTSKLLDTVETWCRGEEKDRLDTLFFNVVLNMLCKQGKEEGNLDRAKAFLDEMESGVYGQKGLPDVVSYTTMAEAYKNTATVEGARRAEELLDRWERRSSSNRHKSKSKDRLLSSIVIDAYATSNTREGRERAENMLQIIVDEFKSGKTKEKIAPTSSMYNPVLKVASPQQAQKIFDQMLALYRSGERSAKPDETSFFHLLFAWSKRSDAPESAQRAEDVLHLKDEFKSEDPKVFATTHDYFHVMQKWGKCGAEDGPERSEALLEKMVHAHDSGQSVTAPNVDVYRRVLLNYLDRNKTTDPTKAQSVLDRMVDRAEQQDGPIPDRKCFTICLHAWANSQQQGCAEKAEDLLNRCIKMSQSHTDENLHPDCGMYDGVLKAFAQCPRDSESLEKGIRLFSLLKESNDLKTSNFTYINMFNIVDKHMDTSDPRRAPLLQQLFKDCCRTGNLSKTCLDAFRNVASEECCRAVFGVDENQDVSKLRVNDFPSAWRRTPRRWTLKQP